VQVDDEPSRFRLLTTTSPEAVLENLAERLAIAQRHTLASKQQPHDWQRARRRDDEQDFARQWHDDHHGRDYGRSR